MIEPDFKYDSANTLNYQTANALIELFDVCYKQGAIHAYQLDDENAAKKFVETSRLAGYYATLCDTDLFGRVTDGRVYTLEKWRILLSTWARRTVKRKLIEWYISKAVSERNYSGIVYPVCMDFYLQGIYHFAQYPLNDLTVFCQNKYVMLQPLQHRRKSKTRDTDDWLRNIQMLCIERAEIEAKRDDGKKPTNKAAFDNFARIFWSCINGRRGALREERRKNAKLKRKTKDV